MVSKGRDRAVPRDVRRAEATEGVVRNCALVGLNTSANLTAGCTRVSVTGVRPVVGVAVVDGGGVRVGVRVEEGVGEELGVAEGVVEGVGELEAVVVAVEEAVPVSEPVEVKDRVPVAVPVAVALPVAVAVAETVGTAVAVKVPPPPSFVVGVGGEVG